jgi:hypothetical protein
MHAPGIVSAPQKPENFHVWSSSGRKAVFLVNARNPITGALRAVNSTSKPGNNKQRSSKTGEHVEKQFAGGKHSLRHRVLLIAGIDRDDPESMPCTKVFDILRIEGHHVFVSLDETAKAVLQEAQQPKRVWRRDDDAGPLIADPSQAFEH